MSKSKSKTKGKVNLNKKKSTNYKSLISAGCVVLAIILVIIGVSIVYDVTHPASGLEDTQWKSVSAYDASDDEVDMEMVYNNYYSGYQGSMSFKSNGTFTFWMSAGNPEDGTHSGTYTYIQDKDKVKAVFDSGDKAVFKIIRNEDNTINRIEVPYGDYTVYFVQK